MGVRRVWDLQQERLIQLRLLTRLERDCEKKLRKALIKQVGKLASSYRTHHNIAAAHLQKEQEQVRKILKSSYTNTARVFGLRVLDGLKARDKFLDAMWDWIDDRALDLAVSITQTTVRRVKLILNDSISEGVGVEETARRITDSAIAIARPRARVIARTELHRASQKGSAEAARSTRLSLMKTWISTEDDRTREGHSAVNGQTVPMNEPFVVEGETVMMPGEGSAENSINCRCVVTFEPA